MLSCRTLRLAPLAAAVALAVSAPVAGAATGSSARLQIVDPAGASCGNTVGDQGQGQTGGNDTIVCGSGVIGVAPSTSVTTTAGPAITAGMVGSVVITTTGNVAIGL